MSVPEVNSSPVETRAQELFEEAKKCEEESELLEREIRNRRLNRDSEIRLQKRHSEIGAFIQSLVQKSLSPTSSHVTDRLREVEHRRKQLENDRQQKKQQELQSEVRFLISAIDGEVRRTIKSLQETTAGMKPLKQFVKETEEQLKSLAASIDSIACKTTFTDDDYQTLTQVKQTVTNACQQALEKTDSRVFAHKKVTQDQQKDHEPAPPVTEADRAATPAPQPVANQLDTNSHAKEYIRLRKFVNDFAVHLKPFTEDQSCKPYRLRLQQFIRTQINTISPESNDHLKQKFQKLRSLFMLQDFEFMEKNLNAREHVLALDFCLDYAAKTFLSVGSKQVLSVPKAAFSFAAIIALLWERDEKFGQLFLGHLMEKCPYIGCYYPKPDDRESQAEYLICCGYVFGPDNTTLESEESFLNRMRSYARIYGALIQSKAHHPHGMRNAWIWLSQTLSLEPKAGITAALLHAFLDVILFRFNEFYKKQAVKVLIFLLNRYIPLIEHHSAQEIKKQSVVQLKIFVTDAVQKLQSGQSVRPEGLISDYFWQKSYLDS